MKTHQLLDLVAGVLMVGSAGLVLMAASGEAHAAPETCDVRLAVVLTPDVPNPRDPGFLSSLLNNHPNYLLTLEGRDADSSLVLDLSGPGPEYRCLNVVETMRKDARIQSIDVEPPVGGYSVR